MRWWQLELSNGYLYPVYQFVKSRQWYWYGTLHDLVYNAKRFEYFKRARLPEDFDIRLQQYSDDLKKSVYQYTSSTLSNAISGWFFNHSDGDSILGQCKCCHESRRSRPNLRNKCCISIWSLVHISRGLLSALLTRRWKKPCSDFLDVRSKIFFCGCYCKLASSQVLIYVRGHEPGPSACFISFDSNWQSSRSNRYLIRPCEWRTHTVVRLSRGCLNKFVVSMSKRNRFLNATVMKKPSWRRGSTRHISKISFRDLGPCSRRSRTDGRGET